MTATNPTKEEKAPAFNEEKAPASNEEKPALSGSKKTAGKNETADSPIGYFLNNFVLPNPDRTQLYIKKLQASNRILGSYGTNDSNLAFVGYGLLFLSESLKHLSGALSAGGKATNLLARAPPLLRENPLLARVLAAPQGLIAPTRALSNLISDIRIFNRMWGLIPLSVWAVDVWAQPPEDPVVRRIVYTQVVANLLYQPLENVAYLAMHGVLPVSGSNQTKLWIYSCYLWALHVVLDLWRLYRERVLIQRKNKLAGEKGEKEKLDFSWYQYLVINLSYLPLTVHWSLEKGCLNDWTVGLLGATAAAASIYPRWKNLLKQ
ncbi:hypothetical protein DUD61_003232 [Geotrichum candidum]|nr:hypothetical protein DUD61_003232 [Geotrichum candidum]